MRAIVYFIALFGLASCAGPFEFPSIGGQTETLPPLDRSFKEPRVYLSRQDKFVSLKEINRSNFILNLSDKIIFSDQREEGAPPRWDKLENIKEDESLKVKISSFCSYTKLNADQAADEAVSRIVQETGGLSYQHSFSVFELLPYEILLDSSDKPFYCSFIFAFKDERGVYNHYNIAQQIVQPFFAKAQPHALSLVRKTARGHYLPVADAIQKKNINDILLLNNTGAPVKNYHLFCAGLKALTIPDFQWGQEPVFLHLQNSESNILPDGVLKCRFFSEGQTSKITGMTPFFQLNFNSLRKNGKNQKGREIKSSEHSPSPLQSGQPPSKSLVDLEKLARSVSVRTDKGRKRAGGSEIPLNSYFHFKDLKADGDFISDYSSIQITVSAQCFNKRLFGRNRLLSKQSHFSFRKKFPIMAVTPPQMFLLKKKKKLYNYWLDLIRLFKENYYDKNQFELIAEERGSYASHCVYRIGLRDKPGQKIREEFVDKGYDLVWTGDSYGVSHPEVYAYLTLHTVGAKKRHGVIYDQRGLSALEKTEKPFLSLKEDIYKDKAGYFKLNFFDIIDDPFFQVEGHKLDQIRLNCQGVRKKGREAVPLRFSWPYGAHDQFISAQALFLNSDIKKYFRRNSFSACRVMFYEDELLRYFSKEMKIIY